MSSVVLQVYDLSQGMARTMSRMILGRQIDGIWHTSVVVYGLEYFYGGGIAWMPPKTTPYGQPVKELPMGLTQKSKGEFDAFIARLSPRYCMEGYHILYHNCNNFTNDCLEFLLSTSLPGDIKDLPLEFLNTPLGRSVEPMINRMMQMTSGFSSGARPATDDLLSHDMVFVDPALENVTSHDQLHTVMKKEKSVLVFWEAEEVLEVSEAINALPSEFPSIGFACVDSARFPYLAPVDIPQIRVYESDKLVVALPGYNLKALRKALGAATRPEFHCKAIAWAGPQTIPIDWSFVRTRFIATVEAGALDAVEPQHMEIIAKWIKRGVVLNIPEFISAVLEAIRKGSDPATACELLAGLALQPVSNEEIVKSLGAGLLEIVGKGQAAVGKMALLVNISAHPKGESFLKPQTASVLPVVLSALSSDVEAVTAAAAVALIALQKVIGSPFSFEDTQELVVGLLDRLVVAEECDTIVRVASALGMLIQGSEKVGELLRELGVEIAEERLLRSENQRVREVGEDLKGMWSAERE